MHDLEHKFSYKFKNIELLDIALTHPSYSNEIGKENYERLEFLGDAVLELVITELLFKTYKLKNEGSLSKIRANFVSQTTLAKVARELELGKYIKLGKGELNSKGKEKDSILSSSLEAVFAAIFIDGGYRFSHKAIKKSFKRIVDNAFSSEYDIDYKTKLQELVQNKFKKAPSYSLVNELGNPHNKVFEVEVDVIKLKVRAKGNSKRIAEQSAARTAFELLINGEI